MPAACYIGGYIAVRIGARADMKAGRNAVRKAYAMQTVLKGTPLYSNV